MTKKIHLAEALCGFHMVIKHLDKRDLIVKYPAGQVIEPGKGSFWFKPAVYNFPTGLGLHPVVPCLCTPGHTPGCK